MGLSKLIKFLTIFTLLFSFSISIQANDIFKVEISLLESKENLTKKQRFKTALKKAANQIFIKLSASLEINSEEEAKQFLSNPTSWLQSYHYQSIKSEGVTIGQKIIFSFDRKLVYKYFQDNNLIVWPYSRRPITLVFGAQQFDNYLLAIKQSNINNMPTLDYRNLSKKYALPVKIPATEVTDSSWLTPGLEVSEESLSSLVTSFLADYVFTFKEVVTSSGSRTFFWKLYDRKGALVFEGLEKGRLAIVNLETIFAKLLQFYSKQYREDAEFLNSISLSVSNVNEFDQIISLEKQLQQLKPVIHKAKLIKMQGDKVEFEIIYQGSYVEFLTKFGTIKKMVVTSESAITGNMEAKWQ